MIKDLTRFVYFCGVQHFKIVIELLLIALYHQILGTLSILRNFYKCHIAPEIFTLIAFNNANIAWGRLSFSSYLVTLFKQFNTSDKPNYF